MDKTSSSSSLFDFNSQAGVMAILVAIRQSSLSAADKNSLRDLVFSYTNGGGDASARVALEQKLLSSHISVSAPKVPVNISMPAAPTAPVLDFGTRRPAPVFTAPVLPDTAAVPARPDPVVAPAVTPVTESITTPEPAIIPTPPPVIDKPQLEPKTAPVPPVPSVPLKVAEQVVPVAATVVANEIKPVVAETGLEPVVYTDQSKTNYLDRIRQIKATVNGRIGNPVNLVDINNEVGREYMNALLDAMKRLSGGAGQVEPAMQRLELAFTAVEVAIDAHDSGAKIKDQEEVLESKAEPAAVLSESEVEVVEPTASPVEVEVDSTQPEALTPADIPQPLPNDNRWVDPSSSVDNPPVAAKPAQSFSLPSEPATIAASAITPAAGTAADALKVNTLMTPDVDAGLDQLLSDWILFKKSGLFGTGPKGREHPLYKNIYHLPIPLLLAGRFEGSTQEIKQSITDYMNGWRYEQGIIYEQGEDFEHYLRRVIRQILDLQKKHRPA